MKNLLRIIKEIESAPQNSHGYSISPSLAQEEEIETIKSIIAPYLEVIEKEVEGIINIKLKKCLSLEGTQPYFDVLQSIQEYLSMLFFADHIELSDKMKKFIKDCDRLDDPWLRDFLYKNVLAGAYSL